MVITAQPGLHVELGDLLNLTCSVDANGLKEISWTESRVTDTDNKVFTNLSAGVSTLTIPTVLSADLGNYSCQAIADNIINVATATITAKSK